MQTRLPELHSTYGWQSLAWTHAPRTLGKNMCSLTAPHAHLTATLNDISDMWCTQMFHSCLLRVEQTNTCAPSRLTQVGSLCWKGFGATACVPLALGPNNFRAHAGIVRKWPFKPQMLELCDNSLANFRRCYLNTKALRARSRASTAARSHVGQKHV